MEARRYTPDDFEQVNSWAKEWGKSYEKFQLPSVGFIVDGFAAYFIYQTDSSVCFLENLVSKKLADAADREKAIDLVIKNALAAAYDLGFRVAYATTSSHEVASRAVEMGARAEPLQILLTKKLTDPS